jgi:hypothetical protein
MRFLLPFLLLCTACGPAPIVESECALVPCSTACLLRLQTCAAGSADAGSVACQQTLDTCRADGGADAGK